MSRYLLMTAINPTVQLYERSWRRPTWRAPIVGTQYSSGCGRARA